MTKKQKKKKKVYRTATHPCGEAVLWSVWRDLWNLNFFAGETEISETRFSGFAKERCIELMKLNGCKEWNYNDSVNVLYWRVSLKYLLVNKN